MGRTIADSDSDAVGGTRGQARSPRSRWPLGDRSGQVMALFAIAAIPLMAMLALGIDVGLLFTARDEAQRAAESGALAGAAVFKGCQLLDCASFSDAARAQAIQYATSNRIRDLPITEGEVQVQVMPDERKVRVFVDRDGVPTFFAHLLGVPVAPIGAVAAAKVSSAGTGQCLQPFWGPDLWREWGDNNQLPEQDETWVYGDELEEGVEADAHDLSPTEDNPNPPAAPDACPDGDCYQPLMPDGSGTGYGSELRNGADEYVKDYGRPFIIETQPPGLNAQEGEQHALGSMVGAGNFQLWRPPIPDPDNGGCENPLIASGVGPLTDIISGTTCSCPISLATPYEFEGQNTQPGGGWKPIADAIQARIDSDDIDARWDESSGELQCTLDGGDLGTGSDCYHSSRVVTVALASPAQMTGLTGTAVPVTFNNLGRILYENVTSQGAPPSMVVWARFLGPAPGSPGPSTGQLVEYLRLVE